MAKVHVYILGSKKSIEILNGGDFLVNCKFNSQFECVPRDTEEFKGNQNLNSNLYRETPRNLSFSILTS